MQGSIDNSYNTKYNGFNVQLQDQTSEIINLYMCLNTGHTNPTIAMKLDDETVTVDDATGAEVGDCINIGENGRTFQSVINDVTGDVVSFNSPVDQAFTIEADVCFGEWNMATVDGSTTTKTFKICPASGAKYDINRINFTITDNSDMDDAKFGGITALTKGIVVRSTDGIKKNIMLISTNGGFSEQGCCKEYSDKAPAGEYGLSASKIFNGQENNGVAIRLDGDSADTLEIIIQDNLTTLTKFAAVAIGHTVED